MDWLSSLSDSIQITVPFMERLPVIRAVLGIVLVFFLPGFAWTLVFFKKLGILERCILSIGLSIALVALSILFANFVLSIRNSGANSVLILITIILIPMAIYYLIRWLPEKQKKLVKSIVCGVVKEG